MRVLITIALFAVMSSTAFAAGKPEGGPRLRPQHPRLVLVIKEGIARSTTFKALVDRIEASDVIVYVGIDPMLKSSLAGALTWMTRAGEYRYVRASLAADLPFYHMIASVAHELQHAVEVIEDTTVVDESSLVAMYRKIGQPSRAAGPSGWDTLAAQRTGSQVRRELISAPATSLIGRSNSTQS